MCLSIPVLSSLHRPYKRFTPRGRCYSNLVVPARTTHVEFQVSGSLWNCRSAANKAEFISAYASLQSLDFLALTETWITTDNTATPTALSSSAHVFSHTPRASGQRGGGTGILISPKWTFSLSPLTHLSIASFEFHAVTVTSPFKLNILIIYRPPGSLGEFINELDALISSFPEDGSPLTVLGDFNLPTSTFDSFLSASFFPLLSSFDLTLSPSPPTHKAGNTLDLIFTRCCSSTNLIATPLQVSDHYLVSFSLSLSSNTSHTAPTRMVSRRPNLRSLSPATLSSSILSSLPSAQTFSNLSPDSASSTLLSSLSASFDSLCPLSSRPARSSPPAPWLDDSLRAHRTGLRAAERKWRKTRLPADLASFHSLLSTFSSSVSAAKANFYHSKFQASASNPRKLFATFSSLLNPPPPPPPSSLSADDFVNHFEKKVDDIRSSFAKSNDTAGSAHTALPCALTSFSPLSPDEISRLVTAGRPTTCPLDPIPSSLLQTISGDLLPYLTSLINSSLTAGYVPSVFKRARVAPLLKKPTLDPSDVNNYRPVSLLSFLSKTLERAVLGQLSCYLSQNDLLDPNQSGFKTSHSTETALLCVTEALRTAKANSLSSALILLDLSAAFDTVNHQILLSTLSELGISGAAHAWIASYLTGRSYQVVNRISACLADISVWMTDHHLKLNLGKTELLFLPGKDCPFHDLAITVDNSIVSSSQSAKNLGVILDNTLSFSTNIKAVTRSCRFMLYNIRRVRPCLTQEAAQVLIQALVISRLDYCNSLLAGLPACAIKPLQLIQNAAARLVFNFPKFSHVTPLLRSLHWLPVEARIRYKTMVLAYGAVRGTAPPYLQALIRPYTQTRALRSSTSGLLASLPLRKYSSRSAQSKLFAALAPQWWNELPHDARFTSTRGGRPIATASCPSPRNCRRVCGGRVATLASGWSCSPCSASRPVTTWPSSSTATKTLHGSSSTVWPTATEGRMASTSPRCLHVRRWGPI
ncbi:uncharacterized protein cyld isoform 2-T2 [Salvelinus alpinus]